MALLDKTALAPMMIGSTHVREFGGKEAFIYYETDEVAHMLLPDGTAHSGVWRLEDKGYSVDWTDGPSGSWGLDNYEPGKIGYIDGTGTRRAEVMRIEFGNPANLPRQ